MSPRSYWFLWILVLTAAAVIWLAGGFTLLAAVVFGFIAFGMTFMGMMCVLPSAVSHPTAVNSKMPKREKAFKPAPAKPIETGGRFSTYRSA